MAAARGWWKMIDWRVRASAPGKVVLSGEYAVLTGAPALVAAVHRRVTCTLTPRQRGGWRFVSTGFVGDVTLAKAEVFRAPQHAIAGIVRQVIDDQAAPAHLHIAIDSSPCYLNDVKLGVGSSAATVTAVAAAFAALGGRVPKLADLIDIHAALQGGGSGLDVAAAVTGGVIRFQERQVLPASLPAGLYTSFVFCGRDTRTADLLAKFDAWRGGERPRALRRLAQAAWDVADCTADAKTFTSALGEYAERLERLDQVAGIGIFGAGHRALRQLAAQSGVVYKPCGAGGDDVGMAVTTDGNAMAKFENAVRGAADVPFQLVEMDVSDDGVQVRTN